MSAAGVGTPRAQDLAEHAVAASSSDECVVLVHAGESANIRFALNTVTTNGVMRDVRVTVVAVRHGARGASSGAVSASAASLDQVEALVAQADAAAADAAPAEDAADLVGDSQSSDWEESPGETSIDVYRDVAPALGDAFERAEAEGRLLYGFVDHDVTTTYLASSTGLRLRHSQPTGFYSVTAKPRDLSASVWVGGATPDFADVDVSAWEAELQRRLGWAERQVDVPAGRHDTVLPPEAVADLVDYLYVAGLGAQDAYDGQSVFSGPDGTARIGDRVGRDSVRLFSDPALPGLGCAPFVTAAASTGEQSVFDNGVRLDRTTWIQDGRLAALMQTRHTATEHGAGLTPYVDNLALEVAGASGGTDDLVAGVEEGLLLTCLWYIRMVDPRSFLLTGLTRDGVYAVRGGEVVGQVTNYRFNESPVDLLGRFTAAGATVPGFSREWGDYFPRTAMPPLRVPDFNMSTVSQAR